MKTSKKSADSEMANNSPFDRWYLKTWGTKPEDTDESNRAFYAWQECKKEILNILKENLSTEDTKSGDSWDYYSTNIKEIIENL